MKQPLKQSLLLFLFIVFASPINAATEARDFYAAGPFKVKVELDSERPKVGKNRVTIWLQDQAGHPVGGATLKAVAVMPAMGSMPAMYAPAEMSETKVGRYEGEFQPSMGGEWPLTIEIEAGLEKGSIRFDLATGRKGIRCATCADVGTQVVGTVRVDPTRRQLIGITTAQVRQNALRVVIRAAGRVTYDETRLRDVTLKFNGWIGTLYANAIGASVKKGAPLFTVYSPELLSAQEEYLELLRRVSVKGSRHRLAAAQRRLRLWGVTKSQIKALGKRGQAEEYVAILSPASGIVIDKQVVAGSAFKVGQTVLRIADLSRVWVESQVYDYERPLIKVGMEVEVLLPELQDHDLLAKVDFIYPFMEGDTHTTRVRVVLDNRDGFLRPNMYTQLRLKAELGRRLLVPESAVLYSGEARVVFLDLGEGRLAPRKIKTGQRNRHWIEVLDGLEVGDTVVTSGNFLIAAESKLKAGGASW